MKKLLFAFLLIGVVAAGGWFYLTPVSALRDLRQAAEAGDAERLRALVDFPALRQSIKDEARQAVSREVAGRTGLGSLGGIGAFFAGQVVDRVVDVAVQPQGIAALTRGVSPGARRDGQDRELLEPDLEVRRGYESFDRFVVSFHEPEDGRQRLALVLRRSGLTEWKLAEVRIGPD